MSQFRDKRSSHDHTDGGGTAAPSLAVGKRTLTQDLVPVQRVANPAKPVDAAATPDAGATAARGTQGAGEKPPFFDRIQGLFGRHDVSNMRVHTDDRAATAASELGAKAYTTGDRVAFAGTPDLHTTAHEAAHVVQQRGGVQLKAGLDGGAGDPYERHADTVADLVVAGRSAEALLDRMAGPRASAAPGQAVQRKQAAATGPELARPHPPSAELVDEADEPAPQASAGSRSAATPGRTAAQAGPTAASHAAAAVGGGHGAAAPGHADPAEPDALEVAGPAATDQAAKPARGSDPGPGKAALSEHGRAVAQPSGAASDAEPNDRLAGTHRAVAQPSGAASDAEPDDRLAGTHRAAAPQASGAAAAPNPRSRNADDPMPPEGSAPDPRELAQASATTVSVGVTSTATPLTAPVPTLAPGSIAAHVRQGSAAHAGLAPPAAAATTAPATPGPSDAATADAPEIVAPAGALPSIATRAPAAAPQIRFAAAPEGELAPDHAASESRAGAAMAASQQRVSALRGYVDGAARSLEPRLATADQAIDAARRKSQAEIRAAMAHLRTAAAARVTAASTEITQRHARTVATVRAAGVNAKAVLDAQAQTAAEAIAGGEAQCVPLLDAAYAAGDRKFRQSGDQIGQEAIAIGGTYRATWMGQLDGESTVMSGPVHDNRLKARAKAADQVAQAYRDQLVAAAYQQADAAQQGKARDREALAATTSAHRDAVLATLRDGQAGIAHAETSAIEAADQQRDNDLKLLATQQTSTLKTIARKEAALIGEVGKHAAGHKQALRTYVSAAVAQCASATDELVGNFDAAMAGYHAQAAGTHAPRAEAIEPELRQQHGEIQHAAEASETRFREVFSGAEQRIAATEGESVQGLGGFAANTRAAAGQINARIAHTIAGLEQHSSKAFSAIEQQHARTVQATTDAVAEANQASLASSTTAYTTATANIEKGFTSSAQGLDVNLRAALKDIHPQIHTAADQAAKQVQPRWKKVLKVLVTIAIVVAVAVVAGPAVIGAVGALAGGLGAGAAAGAIGVVVGGAAVGAASGAVMQISNNVIDGAKWHEGVGTAATIGAISGVFGGIGGLAGKGLTSLGIRTLVTLGFDGAGSVVGNLATGQPLTFEGIAMGLAIGLGMSLGMGGLGRYGGKFGKKVERIQVGAYEAGDAAGKRVAGAVTGRPVVEPSVGPAMAPTGQAPAEPSAPPSRPVAEPAAPPRAQPDAHEPHPSAEPAPAPAADRPPVKKDFNAENAENVQRLLDQPISPEVRADLQTRWQRIQENLERLHAEQGAADPAALARVRSEVDELRQAASSTIHDKTPTPESKVASQNWQRADQKVKAWAASKEPLSLSRIQEINGTLQEGIGKPGTPGQLRNQPASAGGLFHKMYIDPAQLDGRMAAFLEWYHANQSTMPPIELAAGAYQRLVSIHPFADANGRTCRLVMDWILENHGLPPATFGDNEHNIAVYWSDAYNNNGVTTEQAVAAVTKGIERTIQIMGRAGQ